MPKRPETSELRPLAWAVYAVAAMLIIVPLTELAGQLGWKIEPEVLNWRTGAVGLLSGVVLTPTVGLLLAVITAAVFEHRAIQRTLAIAAGFGAVAAIVVMLVFSLDVVQLRPNVVPTMKRTFTIAAVKALINFGFTSFTLGVICFSALRAGRRYKASPAVSSPVAATGTPLLGSTR